MNKPDLETCTLQEACDYAVFKIVEQGGQCLDYKQRCRYGNQEGMHCAVGWLLDHDDEQLMSCGDTVLSLVKISEDGELPSVIYENEVALSKLQYFHDDKTSSSRMDVLQGLSAYIDISAPQYQQWVEMGD